jgi:hypothetical protein
MTTSGDASAWDCALSAKERRLSIEISRWRSILSVLLLECACSEVIPYVQPSTRPPGSTGLSLTDNEQQTAGSSSSEFNARGEQVSEVSVGSSRKHMQYVPCHAIPTKDDSHVALYRISTSPRRSNRDGSGFKPDIFMRRCKCM